MKQLQCDIIFVGGGLSGLLGAYALSFTNQNLIIISQIQRSGGTLLTQLFDNHSTLYSYPSELMVTLMF